MSPLYQFIYAADGLYLLFGGIAAAVILTLIKRRHRYAFGYIEILAGFYLLEVGRHDGGGAFNAGFSSGFNSVQISVTLVAVISAVFLLVSGGDKVAQSRAIQPR